MLSKEPAKNPGTLSQLLLSCLTSLTDVLAFCTSFSDMYMLAFCHGGLSVPQKNPPVLMLMAHLLGRP